MKPTRLKTALRAFAVLSVAGLAFLVIAYLYVWDKLSDKIELRNESSKILSVEIRAAAPPIVIDGLEAGTSKTVRFEPQGDGNMVVLERLAEGKPVECEGGGYVTGGMSSRWIATFRADGTCRVEEILGQP